MSSSPWKVHVDPDHLYFITASAIQHKHIFHCDVMKRILVDSLNTGRILGQYALFAFVIMPNHFHILIRCLSDFTPADMVREYKKATANLIVRQYEAEQDRVTLAVLAQSAPDDQKYAVWEADYQAKNVFTPGFLRQKVTYIHNNPLQAHWRLADRAEDYVWSSAGYYLANRRALIPLSDVRELM